MFVQTVTLNTYSVKPFSDKAFSVHFENVYSADSPCAICGRAIFTDGMWNKHLAVVVGGGTRWATSAKAVNKTARPDVWRVGERCHRRYWKSRFQWVPQ